VYCWFGLLTVAVAWQCTDCLSLLRNDTNLVFWAFVPLAA
jgi:hypothetical protein